MSGIVLKTMTNDEQWSECILGDGTGRRDIWKAVWSSAEGRGEEKRQATAVCTVVISGRFR